MELVAAFLIGCMGSIHCIAMCGPLALALPVNTSSIKSLTKGQLYYNFGRTISYSFLGAVVGLLGLSIQSSGLQEWLSIVTGIMLIVIFFYSYFKALAYRFLSLPYQWISQKYSIPDLMKKCKEKEIYLLFFGIVNGFLPCGFVYIALAGSINMNHFVMSIAFMFFFGLGTIPLMAILIHGRKLLRPNTFLAKLLPVGTLILACLFILRGSGLGVPYVSPNLSIPESCCHSVDSK